MGSLLTRRMTTSNGERRSYKDALLGFTTSARMHDDATDSESRSCDMGYASRIKYIIDIEGFRVGTRFVVKELGVLDVDDRMVWSHYFAVGRFAALSFRDRRQVIYLTNNVHGLRYENEPGDEPQAAIRDHVRLLASRAAREGRLIAYKGGHYERDLLFEVGYGEYAFNIEELGCPRFEFIANARENWLAEAKRFECNRHVSPRGVLPPRASEIKSGVRKRVLHCPRVELWCFMLWLDWLDEQCSEET